MFNHSVQDYDNILRYLNRGKKLLVLFHDILYTYTYPIRAITYCCCRHQFKNDNNILVTNIYNIDGD